MYYSFDLRIECSVLLSLARKDIAIVMRALIQFGADVNAASALTVETPLHFASRSGSPAIVAELVSLFAEVYVVDK